MQQFRKCEPLFPITREYISKQLPTSHLLPMHISNTFTYINVDMNIKEFCAMKKIMLCITALLLTTIFTACNTTTKQKEITLSEVTRSDIYAPQYAAIELGYFEEEGIDIELQTAWGGDKAMTALHSNKADIA